MRKTSPLPFPEVSVNNKIGIVEIAVLNWFYDNNLIFQFQHLVVQKRTDLKKQPRKWKADIFTFFYLYAFGLR